jgi:hypothetical protein
MFARRTQGVPKGFAKLSRVVYFSVSFWPSIMMGVAMKKLVTVFVFLLFRSTGYAAALNTPVEALRVGNELYPTLSEIDGVVAIRVGMCDPSTGRAVSIDENFVYCVLVGADYRKSAAIEKLRTLYPPKSEVNGIFIYVEAINPVIPAPRMSSGN